MNSRKTTRQVHVICALLLMVMVAKAEKPRLAIMSDPGLANEGDLLAVELSKNEEIVLLDRDQISKVFKEQGLKAGGLTEKEALQLGGLLKADGLVILRQRDWHGNKSMEISLVAVDPGIVLEESLFPLPWNDSSEDMVECVGRLKKMFGKLRIPGREAIRISVAGLFAMEGSEKGWELEREITALLIHRLTHEPSLFVLERRNMAKLVFEKRIGGEEGQKFLNSAYVLTGNMEEKDDDLTLNLGLQPPGKGERVQFQIKGRATDPSSIVSEISRKVVEVAGGRMTRTVWDSQAEAGYFFRQAEWAGRHRMLDEGIAAIESARALGKKDRRSAEFQISLYCRRADPSIDKGISLKKAGNAKESHIQIQAAQRSLDLVRDYIQKYSGKNSSFQFDFRIVASQVLGSASEALRLRMSAGFPWRDDEACLQVRQEILEVVRKVILKGEQSRFGVDPRCVQARYAWIWHDRGEDVIGVYRDLLAVDVIGEKKCKSIIRGFLFQDRNSPEPWPWMPPSKNNDEEAWNDFINQLKNSPDFQLQLDGWALDFYSTKGEARRKKIAEKACGFLWKKRGSFLGVKEGALSLRHLEGVVNRGPKKLRLDFLGFFFNQDGPADLGLMKGLLQVDDYSMEEIRMILKDGRRYLEHGAGKGLAEKPDEYFRGIHDVIHVAFQKHPELLKEFKISRGNGENDPVLSVRDFYSCPGIQFGPPDDSPRGSGRRKFPARWDQGRLWYLQNLKPASLISLDLVSKKRDLLEIPFQEGVIQGPKKRSHLERSWSSMRFLDMNGQFLVLADESFLHIYDRQRREWQNVELPNAGYLDGFLADQTMVLTLKRINQQHEHHAVFQYDLGSHLMETLVNTRRKPAGNTLEEGPFQPLLAWAEKSVGGMGLLVNRQKHGCRPEVFRKSKADQWKSVFQFPDSTGSTLDPDIQDGKVLLTTYHRNIFLDEVILFDPISGQSEVLIGNPGVPRGEGMKTKPRWEFPPALSQMRDIHSVESGAVYHDGHLWLLTAVESMQDQASRDFSLWYFAKEKGKSIEIPLRFKIPGEELSEKDGKHQFLPSGLTHQSLILTPHGLVLGGGKMTGFWFIPRADLQGYLESGKEMEKK